MSKAKGFGAKLAAGSKVKVDNHARSLPNKVELRRMVLHEVNAPVFDAFAGSGQMWRRVWKDAPAYVGCDLRWFPDERMAFVADNKRVLRSIDLSRFGIFDLDAYGSPWEQAIIVAARRIVKPGERIGLVITEGSSLKLRIGTPARAMSSIAGMTAKAVGVLVQQEEMTKRAISGLAKRMNCRVDKSWMARGKSAAHVMYYGLVFVGLTA